MILELTCVGREQEIREYANQEATEDTVFNFTFSEDIFIDIDAGDSLTYTQAAISNRVAGIDLSVANEATASFTGTFQPGAIFVPFIIVNAGADAILDNNPNNDPAVYFSFLGANTDKADHIRLLGNNAFGFEDLANGGDRDYNDLIVRVNLSIA